LERRTFLASRRWRITAPIRKAARRFPELAHSLRGSLNLFSWRRPSNGLSVHGFQKPPAPTNVEQPNGTEAENATSPQAVTQDNPTT
jgi:hypothetical protein